MLKKLLLLAGAIIVVGGIAGGALYYFYPVPVSVTAGLVRNFVLSYSAPPGTVETELNPAGQGAAAVTAAPQAQPTAADWPSYNRTLTSDRFSDCARSPLRTSAS